MIDPRPHIPVFPLSLASCWGRPLFAETAEKIDPASLSGLHDIIIPVPVAPYWPLAPGWYLLGGLIILVVGWGLWRIKRRRQDRRYRVEALAELDALRHHQADPRTAGAGILVLLKRTALGAYPRIDVAGLNGSAWWRFLDLSGGKTRFADGLGDFAEKLVYAQQRIDDTSKRDLERLYRAAAQWIKWHRPSNHQSVSAASAHHTPRSEA